MTKMEFPIGRQVWLHDRQRPISSQLTFEPQLTMRPSWSPLHDNRITFVSNLGRKNRADWQLFSMNISGNDKPELLIPVNSGWRRTWCAWSSSGKYLIYSESIKKEREIWIASTGENGDFGQPVLLGNSGDIALVEFHPRDDRYFAYASSRTEKSEIYIGELLVDELRQGQVEKVSSAGGTEPCWARDGKKLFYRSSKGMREVDIGFNADGTVEVGQDQILFDDRQFIKGFFFHRNYDVAEDGRFLMVKKSPPNRVNIIFNWFEELKRMAQSSQK